MMGNPRVLIVDGDPLTRKVVRITLQSGGYSVLEAENGRMALGVLESSPPDLIIQGLVLPDIDGLELIQRIRAYPGLGKVPVLAFSAFPAKLERARSLGLGFADYLSKPTEPSRLLQTIQGHIPVDQRAAGRSGAGLSVLVVEDNPVQRKLLQIHLEQLGFTVAVAEDGMEGLEKARRLQPDAIVSDILMPRLDGFKFCHAIRQDPSLAQVPVVLTSAAFIEAADQDLAKGVGASAFVLRTPDCAHVIQALGEALDARPAATEGYRVELPIEQYADRVSRQLDRQTGLSANLARRLEWMEAKLEILSSLMETTKRSIPGESLVDDILLRALQASGANHGSAYLLDPIGHLALRAQVGYDEVAPSLLAESFGQTDALKTAMKQQRPLEFVSPVNPGSRAGCLGKPPSEEQMLAVPLVSGEECLGALAIAWAEGDPRQDSRFLATTVAGQVGQAIALARALAELQESKDRLRFLSEAGQVLASSLDYEATLSNLAHLVVPRLADWCAIHVIEEDGTPRRLAVTHVDPQKVEMARELESRYPADMNARWGVPNVLRTGEPEIYPDVPQALLEEAGGNAGQIEIARALDVKSVVIVPLLARGQTLGAITLVSAESGRQYSQHDLDLAMELANRAALAVDSARLYSQAQEAIRLRDEFLSVASHELKTPITSLKGFTQHVVRQLDKNGSVDPLQLRRALHVIHTQSDKLSSLVYQLLDVSRLEAGRLVLERKATDVANLVEGVIAAMQVGSSRHTLTLRAISLAPALVDPLRIEQVVVNLIDNAIKYSPGGSAVEVEVSASETGTVRVAVRDHGIGIPPEHRQHIFDRFYQAHGEGQFGGMGLGLYICRQIVDLHGGELAAEFPPDGGTRFVLRLPTGLAGISK